ncbi:MAG: phage regulatory CII family protein [Balneolaceae bacterium]
MNTVDSITNDMTNFSLEQIVYKTIHESELSIREQAACIGKSENYLYRMANPSDDCDLPVKLLLPVMKNNKNYRILEWLNKSCGFMMVKMPRGLVKGTNPKMEAVEYQQKFGKLMEALFDFIKEPTELKRIELDDLMRTHMGDSENMRRRIKRADLEQMDLGI